MSVRDADATLVPAPPLRDRFATGVVLVTVRGAVPVATFDVNVGAVTASVVLTTDPLSHTLPELVDAVAPEART